MELLNKWDIESKWDKRVVETKSATNTIISKFFILNPIPSFKFLTKFLVKISQLKFLVMT